MKEKEGRECLLMACDRARLLLLLLVLPGSAVAPPFAGRLVALPLLLFNCE